MNGVIKLVWALCALLGVGSVVGQERADQLLAQMQQTVAAMDAYRIGFVVDVEGTEMQGTLAVADDRYQILLGDMEVLGDSLHRYEINHARREVTLLPTEAMSVNLLSNPSQALLTVAQSEAALLTEHGRIAELLICPKEEQVEIRLWLDTVRALPTKIRYEQEGIGVDIRITQFQKTESLLIAFDPTRYKAYEMIDFR